MATEQERYDWEQEIKLLQEREYLVVKDNRLIQKSRYALSLQEQKAMLYVVSMIKPSEPPYQLEYTFDVREFCRVCDIDCDSGTNYAKVADTLKRLRDKSLWLPMPDGSKSTCGWLSKVNIHEGSGKVRVTLDKDLVPYLFGLKEQFTQYQLLQVLPMRSGFSVRLYEVLKSYANVGRAEYEIDELKQLLAVDTMKSYRDYGLFRTKVLDVAMKEISATTDLDVSYEDVRKGRKVIRVVFKIKQKEGTRCQEAQ